MKIFNNTSACVLRKAASHIELDKGYCKKEIKQNKIANGFVLRKGKLRGSSIFDVNVLVGNITGYCGGMC